MKLTVYNYHTCNIPLIIQGETHVIKRLRSKIIDIGANVDIIVPYAMDKDGKVAIGSDGSSVYPIMIKKYDKLVIGTNSFNSDDIFGITNDSCVNLSQVKFDKKTYLLSVYSFDPVNSEECTVDPDTFELLKEKNDSISNKIKSKLNNGETSNMFVFIIGIIFIVYLLLVTASICYLYKLNKENKMSSI